MLNFRSARQLALFLLAAPMVVQAQYQNAKYAGEFLSLGVGARSAAVGGAGTAFANDATAGYFNPAALMQITYPEISIFHESRFAGMINYDFASAAIPLGPKQSLGLTALRLGIDEIKDSRGALIDINGNGIPDEEDRIDQSKIKLGSAADWAFMGSYARQINSKLSVGGNVKVFHRSILENSAWGAGLDLSALYLPTNDLTIGATLADASKSIMSWDTGEQEFIVPTARIGVSYHYRPFADHGIRPTMDGIFRFEGRHETARMDLGFASLDFNAGLEYSYKDKIFVRGGYSELGQLSVGAGIKLQKLNIDYAFTNATADQSGLGPTHRISLMLTLEEPKYARATAPTE